MAQPPRSRHADVRLGLALAVPLAAALATALAAACSAERRPAGGRERPLVISTAADADLLVPTLTSTGTGRQVTDQLFEPLAEEPAHGVDATGRTWRPALALRWTWRPDSLGLAFSLDPRARWHDGVPVRAADVRFTYERAVDPALAAPLAAPLADIDSVTAPDSLTAVFWFHRHTRSRFATAAGLRPVPRHLLDSIPPSRWAASAFARRPVGDGRFRFVRWDAGQRIEIAADTTHRRGSPTIGRVVWLVSPDPDAAARRVAAGEADVVEGVRPDLVGELDRRPGLRVLRYPSYVYGALLFNLHDPAAPDRPHPILGDLAVRHAIGAALDRERMVESVFGSLAMVSHGPATRAQWTADSTTDAGADTARARALLDAAGWRRGPDGIRARDGHPLRLRLLTPASSPPRQRLAVLIQGALRPLGVDLVIEPVEFAAFGAAQREGRFDASLMAWSTDPDPGGAAEFWGGGPASDRARGGQNLTGYRSARFDHLLDSAATELDSARSARLYHAAYAVLRADAPAVWLYEPLNTLALDRRVRATGIRPDAWWADLADWRLAPTGGRVRVAGDAR